MLGHGCRSGVRVSEIVHCLAPPAPEAVASWEQLDEFCVWGFEHDGVLETGGVRAVVVTLVLVDVVRRDKDERVRKLRVGVASGFTTEGGCVSLREYGGVSNSAVEMNQVKAEFHWLVDFDVFGLACGEGEYCGGEE